MQQQVRDKESACQVSEQVLSQVHLFFDPLQLPSGGVGGAQGDAASLHV